MEERTLSEEVETLAVHLKTFFFKDQPFNIGSKSSSEWNYIWQVATFVPHFNQ